MCEIRLYKNQAYETLKYQHDSSELFVDTEFPAIRQSLFPSGQSIMRSGRYVSDIIWRRPTVKIMFALSHHHFLSPV